MKLEADVNAGIVSGGQMMLFHQLDICWDLIKPKACWAGPVLEILSKGFCPTKCIWRFKPPLQTWKSLSWDFKLDFFSVQKMQTTMEKFISLWQRCEALIWVHLYRTVRKKGKLRGEEGNFDWQGLMKLLNACLCALTGKHPDPRPLFWKTSWQLCWAMSSLPKQGEDEFPKHIFATVLYSSHCVLEGYRKP